MLAICLQIVATSGSFFMYLISVTSCGFIRSHVFLFAFVWFCLVSFDVSHSFIVLGLVRLCVVPLTPFGYVYCSLYQYILLVS